ncbi:hypothetical protein BPY_08210 [Bifidobacterium psychraerophilum]
MPMVEHKDQIAPVGDMVEMSYPNGFFRHLLTNFLRMIVSSIVPHTRYFSGISNRVSNDIEKVVYPMAQ